MVIWEGYFYQQGKPMARTIFTRVLLTAACAVAFTGIASAQLKVAVIDMRQAVVKTAEIKKASGELEAKYKPRQAQADALQKELDEIQAKIQGGKLTPAQQQDLQIQGQRKQRDLQRLSEDATAEFSAERNEILAKASQRMVDVVKKLSEARGLDLVVDIASTFYLKPALDITNDAVAEYDKAYPAK